MQMPNYPPTWLCKKHFSSIHLAPVMGTQKTVPINFYIICKIQPFQSLRGLVVSAVVNIIIIVIAYADLPNQYQFSKRIKEPAASIFERKPKQ